MNELVDGGSTRSLHIAYCEARVYFYIWSGFLCQWSVLLIERNWRCDCTCRRTLYLTVRKLTRHEFKAISTLRIRYSDWLLTLPYHPVQPQPQRKRKKRRLYKTPKKSHFAGNAIVCSMSLVGREVGYFPIWQLM